MSQSAIQFSPRPNGECRSKSGQPCPEDEPAAPVGGRLVGEEVADTTHEAVVSWIPFRLMSWSEPRKGIVLGSEAKFAVGPSSGRKPDISAFSTAQKLPRKSPIRVPPDLMVEVVSAHAPRRPPRSCGEARRDAAFGVQWYWIVDPILRTLEILKLGDEGHYTTLVSASEGVVVVPSCEGLVFDLDALWARIDELVEDEPDE